MTEKQRKLVENYIRLKVKSMLNEVFNIGDVVFVKEDPSADESFRMLYKKPGKIIRKHENLFVVRFGKKTQVLLSPEEIVGK